jgi:diguanylate cyclase (GGDEF)-like protein
MEYDNSALFLYYYRLACIGIEKSYRTGDELGAYRQFDGSGELAFFYKLAEMEINRFERYKHIFSLAYIDLDNFKTVNDQWGHATGDQLLSSVANYIRQHMRQTDILARLGGDEFALLLPETDMGRARTVCAKIQEGLLAEMRGKLWPVTFSIGVLTCQIATSSVDVLVSRADDLMYAVKHRNKNGIQYATYMG